jgi:hypothetical protein
MPASRKHSATSFAASRPARDALAASSGSALAIAGALRRSRFRVGIWQIPREPNPTSMRAFGSMRADLVKPTVGARRQRCAARQALLRPCNLLQPGPLLEGVSFAGSAARTNHSSDSARLAIASVWGVGDEQTVVPMPNNEFDFPVPDCPSCGGAIRLIRITPHGVGFELRTFDCRPCVNSKHDVLAPSAVHGRKPDPSQAGMFRELPDQSRGMSS